MKVSINIVTWNSFSYLKDCLQSVFNQTMKDFSVLIIDNGSQDETVEFLEKEYGNRLQIIKNEDNQGFAGAHNQGIKIAKENGAEYVLVANPDVILTQNFLEKLISEADKRPDVGSFGGKLLRKITLAPFAKGGIKEDGIIDSAGLKIFKNRRAVEIGAGEKDIGRYNNKKEVFGISGALVLYRLRALEDVKIDSEYFDNNFFAYKEDIDLAWRLQLAGWKSLYIPESVAYHYRGATSKEDIGNIGTISIRRGKSQLVNYLSYRNNLFVLLKNDCLSNFLIDFPRIFWYELRKFIYILFCEQKSLKAWVDFYKLRPKMMKKRKIIIAQAKVGRKEIRRWFN
jgi:GT2 family glycosyltransferase